jgi:hypothetical protein
LCKRQFLLICLGLIPHLDLVLEQLSIHGDPFHLDFVLLKFRNDLQILDSLNIAVHCNFKSFLTEYPSAEIAPLVDKLFEFGLQTILPLSEKVPVEL